MVKKPGLGVPLVRGDDDVPLARYDDDALKKATLNGEVPRAIADTGASATCVQPSTEQIQMSECGEYGWTGPTFHPTNKKSNKIFQIALGNVVPADDIVRLNIPLREAAREAHTVSGITNNLLSINKLADKNYISVFDGDKLIIYDANNTRITVSRRAVLEGWHSEHEGIWRIPLGKRRQDIKN